jgi:hypothetical protein
MGTLKKRNSKKSTRRLRKKRYVLSELFINFMNNSFLTFETLINCVDFFKIEVRVEQRQPSLSAESVYAIVRVDKQAVDFGEMRA